MALMITDTASGNWQPMRLPADCGQGMQAEAEFVADQEGPWRS